MACQPSELPQSTTRSSIDYFLVLDFEATCENKVKMKPQEIIEFPVLKVNAKTLEIESIFHSYVQPTAIPMLTKFCTDLTGITQEMVTGQPILKDVLQEFHKWMSDKGLLAPGVNCCFVTCGDWDLKTMLPSQCKHFNLPIRDYFRKWINIKELYSMVMKQKPSGMPSMLKGLGLELTGRHHSGIDDSKNIAKILAKLVDEAAPSKIEIKPTTELPPFKLV